jgi:hypothetical protein
MGARQGDILVNVGGALRKILRGLCGLRIELDQNPS